MLSCLRTPLPNNRPISGRKLKEKASGVMSMVVEHIR